ncbi:MAG: hypothetical protein QOC93_2191 [Actinomycetota bacterium]|jgi:hypothetical protein|nr:hypothetical protein [Cryptosporangiaceae bacterium]MDQ1677047.1 hypothetical protein [Actinomycetota bacterium]
MRRLRRVAPELLAVIVGLAWGVLSAVHQQTFAWYWYRVGLEVRVPTSDLPTPGVGDWLPYAAGDGVRLTVVALLGVALVRVGQRTAAVLVPVALALLPLATGSTLALDLLIPADAAAAAGLWLYGEAVLQTLVVAMPAVVALAVSRRVSATRPAPILRATTRQVLVRTVSVGLVAMAVGLLSDSDPFWSLPDLGAMGMLLVVAVATGLLIAAPQSLPVTVAQLALGAAVLVVAGVLGGMDWADLGNNDWGGAALGSLGYLVAVGLGPAAVLLAPSAGRLWRRAFRRDPALAALR